MKDIGSMFPTVSIVIPTFNREHTIVQCIESALNQSYKCCELIVVDDGSSDGTERILESYQDRIVTCRIDNAGVSIARNVGVRLAKGRHVQFLDSDDILHKNAIENQLHEMTFHDTSASIPVGKVGIADSSGVLTDHPNKYDVIPSAREQFALSTQFLARKSLQVSMPLYNRQLLLNVGGFRGGLSLFEDFDLNLRLALAGARFIYTGHTVAYVRQHAGHRLTSDPKIEELENVLQMFKAFEGQSEALLMTGALTNFAKMAWSVGRICARMNYFDVARKFFKLAYELDSELTPIGSRFYRFLCTSFGPCFAESFLESCKKSRFLGGNN